MKKPRHNGVKIGNMFGKVFYLSAEPVMDYRVITARDSSSASSFSIAASILLLCIS